MTSPSDAPAMPPAPALAPAVEPRQRWRLTFARDPVSSDQVGRAVLDAWHTCLVESGLPVAGLEAGGAGRARLAFGAPLPAGATGEAELAELWLLERWPLWRVREALADRLPAAHRWIRGEDVWLGAPPLAGRIVAADWRIELARAGVDSGRLAAGARAMVSATTLPRVRMKGTSEKRYDLRPLLDDVVVDETAIDRPIVVRVRTRFDPELGSGRPDEIVAALGEAAGFADDIEIGAMTRERLVLADDLAARRRR